jgi:hypothetical protein
MPSRLLIAALVALPLASASVAHASSGTHATRIGLVRELIDGSAGKERLVGRVVVSTAPAFHRVSPNGAPTAKFTVAPSGGCRARIEISVRAVASHQSAKQRAHRVTSTDRFIDVPRAGGWLAVAPLRGGMIGAQVYGIAVVRVARHRWADVRAYGWFTGCTGEQIRSGEATTDLEATLKTADVQARVKTV